MTEVGTGPGEGSSLNLPLPGGSSDEIMACVFEEVIVPAAQRFKPDIILVSAGYVPSSHEFSRDCHLAFLINPGCHDYLSNNAHLMLLLIFGLYLLYRFDAHVLDPLAGLQFTTGTYYRLASDIKRLAHELCGGRCIFFLEGGYDLKSLSNSVADSFRAFLGDKSLSSRLDNPAVLYDEPSLYARQAIDTIRSIHSL